MEFCKLHGEYKAEEVRIFGYTFKSNCPQCAMIQEEQAQKAEAERIRNNEREERLRRGIEDEFKNATLENFHAENPSEQEALEACKSLDSGAIRKVVLLGSNGVGKTHLACALANKHGGIVITMFKLSDMIRRSFKDGYTECEVLDKILSYPFIAIDEIGRTKGSDAEKNWLSYLVDKAHTRGIRLLLISNRHSARFLPEERKGEAFEYYIDNDVISRLHALSRVVEINGRDRRN